MAMKMTLFSLVPFHMRLIFGWKWFLEKVPVLSLVQFQNNYDPIEYAYLIKVAMKIGSKLDCSSVNLALNMSTWLGIYFISLKRGGGELDQYCLAQEETVVIGTWFLGNNIVSMGGHPPHSVATVWGNNL